MRTENKYAKEETKVQRADSAQNRNAFVISRKSRYEKDGSLWGPGKTGRDGTGPDRTYPPWKTTGRENPFRPVIFPRHFSPCEKPWIYQMKSMGGESIIDPSGIAPWQHGTPTNGLRAKVLRWASNAHGMVFDERHQPRMKLYMKATTHALHPPPLCGKREKAILYAS